MPKHKKGELWEDREVLFDLPFSYLKLRANEKIFDRIEPVEDTKGNSGSKGRLLVTNLRIIWHSLSSPRINISIGLNCIITTNTKIVNSGLRGTTQALYALAGFKNNKYEFIFTNLAPNCVRHYSSVASVHKAYASSRLYRDLKLRGAIIHNKQLKVLPLEKVCFVAEGVWSLSGEAGAPGALAASDVRLVWRADDNDAYNVSMPYLTIESISIRDSKFGEALVIAIRPSSGGFVLGFRVEREKLRPLLAELQALHAAYSERPVFGVQVEWGNDSPGPAADDLEQLEEVGEPRGEMGPHVYLAAQARAPPAPPAYSARLGLAVQPLPGGFTLQSLFEAQTAS